jgi:hypothetical protein
MEMAGFEPAVHTDISRVILPTYGLQPPLKTVTRLSPGCASKNENGTGLNWHEYTCFAGLRSVAEATKDIKSKTPEVYGLEASFAFGRCEVK